MAITLAEAKVSMADKVDQQVVDMFRRSSLLLDSLTFDNIISPGTGGSTLVYGYTQLKTPSTAAIRQINSEYTANEAKREEKTTKAVIMGGSFNVDRVIQNTSGAIDEIAFQAEDKIKATANEFSYLTINGTSKSSDSDGIGAVPNTFDGLKQLLHGTSNEQETDIDISTSANMDTNYNALLDEIDNFMSLIDGTPDMIIANKKLITKLRGAARRAGYYERTKDDFGRVVETYNGVMLFDPGEYYDGTSKDIVEIDSADGTTDLFVVKFGLDAFHGISPTGTSVISSYMPDMTLPGAVKTGEVELVAGVALKNTLKAGVLHGIKVNATE